MKELPILFSTPMVQAILEGRKTQTRRILDIPKDGIIDAKWGFTIFTPERNISFRGVHSNGQYGESFVKMKWCKGDILYVRESWRIKGFWFEEGEVLVEYADGNRETFTYDDDDQDWVVKHWEKLIDKGIIAPADGFDADDATEEDLLMEWVDGVKHSFKPSIHLPKWCSRIWLQVEDVRVERLQDISASDAVEEGIEYDNIDWEMHEGGELVADFKNYTWRDDEEYEDYHFPTFADPINSYRTLWQKINSRESWNANPWVWAVKFKVLSTTGKPQNK